MTMQQHNTELIIPEFKELVAKSFNVAGFIDSIKREYGVEHYNNGALMFEWMLRYHNLHKIQDYIEHIKSYTISSGVWDIPLLIDTKTKIAFIFVKEANLNQKRKEINSSNILSKKLSNPKPPHYAVRLSKLNRSIANQLSLDIFEEKTPYEILREICPSIVETDVPEDLKLMIVTFKNDKTALTKITAGFYDQRLMKIYEEDWSEYIDNNYSSILDNPYTKDKITEINNKIIDLENKKDDLTEFIDDELSDDENKEDE